MKTYNVTFRDIKKRIEALSPHFGPDDVIYGVPRGGVPIALMMAMQYGCDTTGNITAATVIVDDLVDSGETRAYYKKTFHEKPFVTLYNKQLGDPIKDAWLVFPWEKERNFMDNSGHDIFIRLLQFIGEDPHRPGLVDTPRRMADAWDEWTDGYDVDPQNFVKVFEDGAEQYDEMVIERNIPFYSHCEHHLAPFFGVAHVAYIPEEGSVLGISKIARIVDMFAHRLQIQERMTNQIAATIADLIPCIGVAVTLEARHLCMESRGVNKTGQSTVTSAMVGVFRDNVAARNEFLGLIR